MTFPSSGLLTTVQSTINTTVTQAATAVLNPSFGKTGTPQINQGNNAYPLGYDSASISMASGALPVGNTYRSVGATDPASGSNTLFGIEPIGATQGNAKNPSINEPIPAYFALIYQQLLNMAAYTYRM